jgi:quercetin dioxygenase-like cupin family protein
MRRAMILTLAAALALLSIDTRAEQNPKDGGGGGAGVHAADHHVVITQDQLRWEDAKMLPPGAKVAVLEGDPFKEGFFTMRLKFPAGYRIPPHFHPVPERVTVLSGTFHVGPGETFDEKGGKALPAGSYTIMPPQMRHFAWADDETVVQLSTIGPWGITYVNPADDPRKQPAAAPAAGN